MKVLLFLSVLFISQLAYSGELAVVVHPENPVTKLSEREVKKLFLGKLRMYPDSEIETMVLDQNEGSPSYESFYEKVIGMSLQKLKRYRAYYLFSGRGKLPESLKSGEAVKAKVAKDVTAIGYIDAGLVDGSVKVVFIAK